MRSLLKLLLFILLPVLLILTALYTYYTVNSMSPNVSLILEYLPFGVLCIGMLLALRFNKSNIFFPLLVFLLTLFCLLKIDDIINPHNSYETLLHIFIGIVVPLNIVLFSFLKERGFFTLWGILKFVFIATEFIFFIIILLKPNHKLIQILEKEYISLPISLPLPQLILVFLTASFIILTIKAYFSKSYFCIGMLMSFIATSLTLYLKDSNGLLLLFTSASLILILAVIQDSYRMSYIDELTGLPGRRALKEEMLKLSGSYTIAMVDIDFFKKFNDKHGHDVGDEVLKMVASCLSQVTGGGKAFRYGGEEFTILFSGKDSVACIPHLESMRDMISKRAFTIRGKNRPKSKPKTTISPSANQKKLYVTISIGVATRNNDARGPIEVLKNADKALYRAKKKGRNCVSK